MPEPEFYTLVRGGEVLRQVDPDAFPALYAQGWRGSDAASKKAGTALQKEIDGAHADATAANEQTAKDDEKAIKAAGVTDAPAEAATTQKVGN